MPNVIVDVRVGMNFETREKPVVYCLFDSIQTDHLIFDVAGNKPKPESEKGVLEKSMNLTGYNLLAIDQDLAVWYFYSAVNQTGMYRNLTLKRMIDGKIVEQTYDGLWSSNPQAVNLWFPKVLVMSIRGTDSLDEFNQMIGMPMGAVAASVAAHLNRQGWKVGLVLNRNGYIDVEPLMPDDTAKNGEVIRLL